MKDWGLEHNATLDDLIWVYEHQNDSEFTKQVESEEIAPQSYSSPEAIIDDQQKLLAYRNLYNVSLQHIKVDLNPKKTPKLSTNNFLNQKRLKTFSDKTSQSKETKNIFKK